MSNLKDNKQKCSVEDTPPCYWSYRDAASLLWRARAVSLATFGRSYQAAWRARALLLERPYGSRTRAMAFVRPRGSTSYSRT
ncbi:hypothetical protein PIB30_013827 [Stylosanthes scabra]|uniref:Uncharacterized protein n=1 Tax=Stylosanthes scabra TaxID=79078 RepID=A0ABU6S6Q9_9FABA|nr:hypothetical protein [Stylosanthes scabra]